MVKSMHIGVFAARANVPAKTIRYYESIGLLPAAARDANGYRAYAERDLTRLLLIRRLRLAGVHLTELKEILDSMNGHCSTVRERLGPIVDSRLAAIEQQLAELATLHTDLQQYRDELRTTATTDSEPSARFCDCDPATCGCRGDRHD